MYGRLNKKCETCMAGCIKSQLDSNITTIITEAMFVSKFEKIGPGKNNAWSVTTILSSD